MTGEVWAGDVGQNRLEEIDLIKPGRNYGWRIMEGSQCFSPSVGCDPAGLEPPVVEYPNPEEGCAVIGGHVYRGGRVSGLDGAYVYGDFCSGRILALRYDGQSVTDQALLVDTDLNITSFGTDDQAHLYIVDQKTSSIYRFAVAADPMAIPAFSTWSLLALAAALSLVSYLLRPSTRQVAPR